MTGWEVQEMWERDTAALWERLNAPDPCEKMLKDASKDITEAVNRIDKAEDSLCDAISGLSGTPMEDVVTSFLNQLSDLKIDLRILAEKYGRGQRE